MHLRKGLVPPVRRVASAPGADEVPDQARAGDTSCESFGIAAETQRALARFRTDLDAFSDVEVFSLELDGYRMTAHVLPTSGIVPAAPAGPPLTETWPFKAVSDLAAAPDAAYGRRLRAAASRGLKPLAVMPHARLGAAALALVVVALLVYLLRSTLLDGFEAQTTMWTVAAVAGGLLVLGASYASGVQWAPVRIPTELLVGTLLPIVFALPLFVVGLGMLGAGSLHLRLGRMSAAEGEQPVSAAVPHGP
jgi:NTE family protein